jgi:uncharacterized membrane protein
MPADVATTTQPLQPRFAGLRRFGFITMAVIATLVALFSARYFSLNPAVFIPAQVHVFPRELVQLLLHVGGGVTALAVGPWQLWLGLRRRRRNLHRWLGRVYVTAAVVAGVDGLLLAPMTLGGPVAHLGFAGMGVAVLFTTGMAFLSIRRHRIAAHRAWMLRSYAVIFSAGVGFRAWLFIFGALGGLPWGGGQSYFDQVYAAGSWTSWLIGLLIAGALIPGVAARYGAAAATAHVGRARGLGTAGG